MGEKNAETEDAPPQAKTPEPNPTEPLLVEAMERIMVEDTAVFKRLADS